MKKILLALSLAIALCANAQVSNDECTGAIVLPVNGDAVCTASETGNLNLATPSPQNNCVSPDFYNDLWYQFTAVETSHKLILTPDVPEGNLSCGLYTGNCGDLVNTECAFPDHVFTNLTVGETYYLKVYSLGNVSPGFTLCLTTLPPVLTIGTNLTTEQLVTDVLINSSCLSISNISGGAATATATGLGNFDSNGSSFTSSAGIVLSTGNVSVLPGPATGYISSDNGNPAGDADLSAIMATYDYTGAYYNTSSIEFDFVPAIDHISFDYVFASNEYGVFQCDFADAFAFLLTDVTTGTVTNLAVIPGTTIPVSATTIRDMEYNSLCPSSNAEYFDEYWGNNPLAPVNMLGQLVPLTAESAVIPGHQYHIKLVIGDYLDTAFDSAVFIDAGSFNIGAPEYAELTLSGGNILCGDQTTTISINIDESYMFQWSYNGVVIAGENGNSIIAAAPGEYTVSVTLPGGCILNFSSVIIEGSSSSSTVIEELPLYYVFEEDTDGYYTFNLNAQTALILGQFDSNSIAVSYYFSLADAQSGVNMLLSPYSNISNPQTLYVRLENTASGCFTIRTLKLVVVDENFVAPAPVGSPDQDFAPGSTLGDVVVEGENILWYNNGGSGADRSSFTNDDNDTPLPLSTVLVDGATYYASQTIYGRESLERLAVTVHLTLERGQENFAGFASYPNPVKNVLTITNNNTVDGLVIYNLLGQAVYQNTSNSTEVKADLSDFSNGVYLVKIKSGGQEKSFKIVKN